LNIKEISMPKSSNPPVEPREALARLREGNARFVNKVRSLDVMARMARLEDHVEGQWPFAIILSCSDSRVPAELVFDCGLGDLFVVRVAGNVVAPSLVGSVEFAAAKFDSRLVVVMGHSGCGAIAATIDALKDKKESPSENIHDIVERISPSIAEIVQAKMPPEEMMHTAIRANVRASANHLRHASRILERKIAAGELLVVGAEYSLATGRVDFFDGIPG
jgi:carbonic anhydrase